VKDIKVTAYLVPSVVARARVYLHDNGGQSVTFGEVTLAADSGSDLSGLLRRLATMIDEHRAEAGLGERSSLRQT
jgi:hypothetical protein